MAIDPEVFPDEETQEAVRPFELDLDALTSPRLPVHLGGETYHMLSKNEMSMADREDLRLIMLQISELQEQSLEGGADLLRPQERKTYEDLERRIVHLAIPDMPEKVIKGLDASRRNAIIDRFFVEVDVTEVIRSFAATMRLMQHRNRERTEQLKPLARPEQTSTPPLPPVDLLAHRPSSTTGTRSAPTP